MYRAPGARPHVVFDSLAARAALMGLVALGGLAWALGPPLLWPDPADAPVSPLAFALRYPLGPWPLVSAFTLVEFGAAIVPKWRPLRRAPEGRTKLERTAFALALAFALLQALGLVEGVGKPLGLGRGLPELFAVALLVGQVGALALLARWLGRRTLVGGLSFLAALAMAPGLLPSGLQAEGETWGLRYVWTGLGALAIVAATVWALRWHERASSRPEGAPVRVPLSGIAPLTMATSVVLLPAQLDWWLHRRAAPASLAGPLVVAAVAAPLVFFFARWFTRLGGGDANSAPFWSALKATYLYLGAMLGVRLALGHLAPDVGLNEAALALATAVALDALDEARARRAHGLLVPVANEHDPAALAGRLAALREAGVPAHARGAHHRALYQLYAPYVPIALYVPAGRERAARAALGLPDEGAPLSFGS